MSPPWLTSATTVVAPNSRAAATARRAQPAGDSPAADRSASTWARVTPSDSLARATTTMPQALPVWVVVGSTATTTLS